MAITRVGSTATLVSSATNGTLTFTEPTGTQKDDYLVVWIGIRGARGYQTPTGWSKLQENLSGNTTVNTTASAAGGQLFYIKRGASAPALSFTANATGTADLALGRIYSYRGVHPTNPIWDSTIAQTASTATTITTNSLSVPLNGLAFMGCMGARTSANFSAYRSNSGPTSFTELDDGASALGADGAHATAAYINTVDTLGDATMQATCSLAALNCIAVAVFRPAPDQPPTRYNKNLTISPADASVGATVSTTTFNTATWDVSAVLCMTHRGTAPDPWNGISMWVRADATLSGPVGYRIQVSPEYVQLLISDVAASDDFTTHIEVGRPFKLRVKRTANNYITVLIDNEPILVHNDATPLTGAGYIGFTGDNCGMVVDTVTGTIPETFDNVTAGAKFFDDVLGAYKVLSVGSGSAVVAAPTVRYIREYIGVNTVNSTAAWVEMTATGVYTMANEASGKSATLSFTPVVGTASRLTDGDTNSANYVSYDHTGTTHHVMIDLGASKYISNINALHYYSDGRTNESVKLQVSDDAVKWITLFDSERGSSRYAETSAGKTHAVYDPGLVALQDTFDDNSLDAAKWSLTTIDAGVTVAESSGKINVTLPDPVNGYYGISSVTSSLDLTGRQIFVRATPANQGVVTDSKETIFVLQNLAGSHRLRWTIGYGGVIVQVIVGGVQTDLWDLIPCTDVWFRIRENMGTIYFDTAPATATNPPSDTDWTNRATYSVATFGSSNLQAFRLYLTSGAWESSDGAGTATFDGLNTVANSTGTSTSVSVTGVTATASLGTTTQSGKAGFAATGLSATSALGTPVVTGKANLSVSGVSATAALGTAVAAANATAALTGVSATASLGTANGAATSGATVTGLAATASLGVVSARGSVSVEVTSLSATGSVGEVAAANPYSAVLIGVEAIGSVGSTGFMASTSTEVVSLVATGGVGVVGAFMGSVVELTGMEATGQLGVTGFVGQQNTRVTLEDLHLPGMVLSMGSTGVRAWGLVNDTGPNTWLNIQTE